MNDILNIKCKKFVLDNGLQVVLYPDNSLPIVSVNLWYKVGSSFEQKGKTGFAHLFEHMMFQGSENIPKEKHFHYIQEAGGSLNGSTSIDRTNYYESVPSNDLEMVLWLESDRMGFLLSALTSEKLENQREVVMNERLQRYDNQPYGRAWEILFSNLFPENHPYHWPTIGWMDDIKSYELQDVKEFFRKYYAPNNASLVIGGDINLKKTEKLVKKYFDEFKAAENVNPPLVPDFQLTENVVITEYDNIQLERIYLVWRSEKLYGEYDAALDLLADIMAGSKNSRLFKSLVFEKQIAQDVSTFQYSGRIDGSFIIVATARPGSSLSDVKKEILEEINKVCTEGITKSEMERSRNSAKSSFIYSLQNLDSMTDQLNNYNCYLNEPNSFKYDMNRFEIVDSEQVKATASKFLTKPYVELQYLPKKDNNGSK